MWKVEILHEKSRKTTADRAGPKPMQLHWTPRHGVWQVVHFCQILLAPNNSVETVYKPHCLQTMLSLELTINLHKLSNDIRRAQFRC